MGWWMSDAPRAPCSGVKTWDGGGGVSGAAGGGLAIIYRGRGASPRPVPDCPGALRACSPAVAGAWWPCCGRPLSAAPEWPAIVHGGSAAEGKW